MIQSIVFYSEIGGFHGGVERFVYQAANALKEQGIRCSGVFSRPGAEVETFASAFDAFSFSQEDLPDFCRNADWLWIHKSADCSLWNRQEISCKKAVYVHDHDYYCFRRHKYWPVGRINCTLPCSFPLCYLCGTASRHHSSWKCFQNNLDTVRKADLILAGSEFMLHNLQRNGFQEKRLAGLEPLIHLSVKEKKWDVVGNEILYVGQVIRGKGVDLLLRAFSQLPEEHHLTVVGTGDALDSNRDLARRLGVAERVSFSGFHTDLSPFYEKAALAVFPSRWQEPFGMTGPEALAQGIPVIAFDVGGVREWLSDGENGVLVSPGNVDRLAKEMDLLLRDRVRAKELGACGIRRMSCYTSEVFAQKVLRIFGEH